MLLAGRDEVRFQTLSRRALILGGAQAAVFTALASRMYYLQVLRTDEYQMLAEENRVNIRLLPPLRGEIVDRFGATLASNRQNFRVLLIPEQTPDINRVLDMVSRIVPLTDYQRKKVLRDAKRSAPFLPLTVAENLTWEQFARINIHEPDLPGILPDVGETRHYPYGPDLAHVVGYVAAVSDRDLEDRDPLLKLPGFRIGRSGIEKRQDTALRGKAGSSQVEVNAYGRVIRELAKDTGTPGTEVVLTLDMDLQRFAAERLKGEAASAVVLDIHSGDVLVIASTPAFDPNDFNVGLSQDLWDSLTTDRFEPLVNKAIAGQYPPGSTFKMIVALAALESGLVDPRRQVYCSGKYSLGSHDFHCWKKEGHGYMDMHDGIKHSCDVYFYDTARKVGIDRIAEMATRFGLGQTFDFDVPGEKQGLVPTQDWKRGARNEAWQQGETLITGIGQGFLLVTPLQLAVMVARIGNGGRTVVPRLTRAIGPQVLPVDPTPDMGIDPAALKLVQSGMDAVSNDPRGTAYRARIPEEGMHLAGKTGTAQVRRISRSERASGVIKNDQLEWLQRDHALFVAFAPVQAPQYAISIVIEHGGSGSGAAAPVARDIMRKVLERDPSRRPGYLPAQISGVPPGKREG